MGDGKVGEADQHGARSCPTTASHAPRSATCTDVLFGTHNHADEPEAINRNYAGVLPIWDRLFGTFHLPDRYPLRYGADRPVPNRWWGQMIDPLRRRRDPGGSAALRSSSWT
ncbi:hypothetical protein GCM10022267_87530 [Lentzea roselyniae]|uniref:Uncharacterized protein n=1 Tax=Lentzea roselyniae TaxID=531940 RepID=A0ABP7CFJ2_9PSEU